MKASNANKVISVLLSVAMCPMMVPTAAFAADDGTALGASTAVEQAQPADQAEASGTGASSGNTLAAQSETAGEAATGEAATGEAAAPAAAPVAAAGEASGEEAAPAEVAQVGEKTYTTLEDAFAALNSSNRTLKLLDESAWDVAKPVYYKAGKASGYVAKLTDALTAAYQANAGDITIVCRPGSDLGTMTHGHVADSITIYGNGAYVSGGECDLEVDTYQYDRSTGKQTKDAVTELAGKTITISAYDVANLGVWGQRNTDATVNVNLTNCDGKPLGATNVQRVYISGTSGVNNFTLTDCDFITGATAVYSNADGAVAINNCSFTDSTVPVNFNHKATGTQTVTVAGSKFTNCGTTGDWAAFAAPARFVNSAAGALKVTIDGCSFAGTAGVNGDILIGDGRTGKESNEVTLTVTKTAADVQAQKPGYYGEGTTVADASLKGEVATTPEKGLDGASIGSIVTPAPAGVAEVNGVSYPSLQKAIDAASRNATVKLLADTKENVTISTSHVTLDLNGHTLNGSTGERKPALTVTSWVNVKDSSEAQTGTIMREDTAENSGISSHYVIDVQGGKSGWLFFQGGTVKNDSGAGGTKGASLVRVGDDSKPGLPKMTITGGTFTQNNFIVLKCDSGILSVAGGTINSANSYTIQNWKTTYIKDGDHGASRPVINGNVSTWTYNGSGSSLEISGGTVNGNVESVTYDGVEGEPAKVSITGGTVNGTLNTVDYSTGTTSNDPTKATVEVTGGTFSTDPSRYVVENFAATKNADGMYGVEKAYLAQVGETSYYTMDEAFDAQTKTGKAITLLRDYTTGGTFNSGTEARVVDLNGHTWTCTGTDANSAAFEINYPNASLTVKNGKIVSSQLVGLIPSAMGGTITYDNSALTFEGVEATTTATSGIETNGNNTNDTVVLKNSTLNVPNGFGIYFPSSGTLTIDNSTINAKTMGAQVCSGNLNVTAGSAITVSGDPVEKLEGDGAIQDGAAISIVNRPGYKGLGQIAITGGTFKAKGDNAAIKAYTWDSSTKQESAFDNSAKTVAVSGGTFSAAVASDLCAKGYAPVKNEDGTYDVKEETRGTEARPYTLAELGDMTRAEYVAAQEALGGTMYVTVGDYTYDKNGVLGNGERNDTPGQNPDHSKLNAYGENGYLNEKNDGANGKNIVFVNGSITSGATGYTNIDNIGTSLLLAVPAYTNVTFKGIAFNNVMSFDYQLYTSPWSQLGELKFDGCTFNGIIVGAIAAQTLTFNGCTFTNYTNTTSANNSNPTWIRPAYGNWTAGDNKGQGDNFQSLTKINFTGNTVTSTRPVKFEYISQWDIRSTVTVTNNSFDISAQDGDTAIKNVGLYLGAHTKTNAFDLVADNNTKSDNTAALYTIPKGETSLPLGSTVTNTNGEQIELTDALKWKATDAEQDKIVLKTVKAVASVGDSKYQSLTEAIDAAQDGETVTLLTDATEDVAISKSITLDLGGKTLTNTNAGNATISVQSGTVTVKNGNVVGGTGYYNIEVTKGSNANLTLADVTATAGNTGSSMIDNWGTLTIESGSYSGGLDVVKSEEDSTLNINGGKFELSYATNGYTGVVFAYGNTTITGGEFIQSLTTTGRWNHPQVIATGVVEGHTAITRVTGGHFVNKMSGEGIFRGVGKGTSDNFEVSGGTFNKGISEGFCADGFIPTKNADGTYGVKEGHYVAQIGSKKYETLADAIHWATKGKTITLLTDVEQNSQLTIDKSITLDLSGKTIKNTQDIWGDNTNAILSITNGAKVTITGDGTIDAKENDCYTINVVKGDLTIENGTFYGNVSVVQVQEGTLSVKGGSFDLHQKWDGSSKYLFNCIDKAYVDGSANVAISGGTFFGFDPSASPEGEGTSYLVPGYAPTNNGDGTYGVVAGVAQIGAKAYASLQAAIDAAQAGDIVQLLNDTTENITIAENKQITLDLNGYTLDGGTGTAKAAILNKGNVTITDTSAGKTGTIKRDDQGVAGETSYYVIDNNGTMVIDQANVFNNSGAKGSSLIRNGGVDNVSSLTINGGTFEQQNFIAVKNDTNGELTINGGTLTSTQSVVQNWNKAQILGGNLTGIIWTDSWTEVGSVGETVIGGNAQFTGRIYMDVTSPNPSTLKIEGGKLDVTNWTVTDAAVKVNASIAVSGGTFTAAVPAEHCAAGYVPVTNADSTYGVAVGKFTVQVTSRTTTSGSPVANVSGGGSDVTYAEGTTVTASTISGYNFVGWFVNEYAGTPYSTDLTCTVKPTDNCTMIAVYEPVSGGKFWLTVTASEFTVNGGAVQDSYLYEQYAIGASVTVNFTGTENFLYWVNASNKVVSTNKSYTFTMGSETALKAVYGKARQNQATVVFISHSDQIISSKAYTTSGTIQFPVPPIKMGCTFTGWSMTEAEIHEAMANNNGIIQVRALYTEPSIDCKVTVVYPDGADSEVVNAKVGQLVNVTAKDIEGKTFSCWTDNDGNVLGYTKTLKLAPSGNMTVKAIYSDEVSEAKPVISISEVSAAKANEGYVVTFMATRAVPEDYQVVKQGILWSRDAACGEDGAATYMQFDSNGKLPTGVNAYIGNSLELNGVTRLDITTKYNDRTFYGRGYMILKSDAGELLYIYTDTIASGSYDSLTK